MVVLNNKFVIIVLELFLQHVSFLFIDFSKINKIIIFWSILLQYEVQLYFRIFNPEIRKQSQGRSDWGGVRGVTAPPKKPLSANHEPDTT